jgi:aspartate racemase
VSTPELEGKALKTIGLIGGMSWESSLEYYRALNRAARDQLGGLHSAKCVLFNMDLAEIEGLRSRGQIDEVGARLAAAAASLEQCGCDLVILCTNTMHKVADQISAAIRIPFLHIADATARAIQARGLHTVGLLGTRPTMEEDFYRGRLTSEHGLEVLVPDEAGRRDVHRVIFEELCLGRIEEASRARFVEIIADLTNRGAGGVILGCTEIGLLVRPEDVDIATFDTAAIHAAAAAELAFAE